jgi:CelD/BcsL family acetyltransferase involved in cellulose biosynthesis
MSALELDGRVIAAAYSLRCNGCFFYWIPSFDAALRSMSLGKALIAELIERRFAECCSVFDFMGGEEKYKYQWSNGEYDVISVSIYRSRLEGVSARVAMVVRARLRRALAGRRWLIRLRVTLSKVFAPMKSLS